MLEYTFVRKTICKKCGKRTTIVKFDNSKKDYQTEPLCLNCINLLFEEEKDGIIQED